MTKQLYWPTLLFFSIIITSTLIAVPIYIYFHGFPLDIALFALAFSGLTNLSITAGYHRFLAHRSYEAHPIAKLFFLLIGASAWQGSALKWCSDHRKHHLKVDSDEDPYSISKGFWYAHMGWLFWKESVDQPISAPDLQKDKLVYLQDKYYVPVAIFMSFAVPTLVGWAMGAPLAGFLIAGALRVVLTQQSTFLVNSLAHTLGSKTYSDDISARDSIIVALLTHGEGYHNFHHHFQIDYRNGVRWYHWDPTKWTIRFLALIGMAKKLRYISEQEILKARLQMDSLRMRSRGYSHDKMELVHQRILAAQESVKHLRQDLEKIKQDVSTSSSAKIAQLKLDLELAKIEFRYARKQWKRMLQAPAPGI